MIARGVLMGQCVASCTQQFLKCLPKLPFVYINQGTALASILTKPAVYLLCLGSLALVHIDAL